MIIVCFKCPNNGRDAQVADPRVWADYRDEGPMYMSWRVVDEIFAEVLRCDACGGQHDIVLNEPKVPLQQAGPQG